MKALIQFVLVLFVGGFLLTNCIDPPSFEDVPLLSNPQVIQSSNPLDVTGVSDSVVLQFDFADGNGDIGYEGNDPAYLMVDSTFIAEMEVIDTTLIIDTVSGDTTLQIDTTTIPSYYDRDTSFLTHVFLFREYFNDTITTYRIPRIPANGGVPDITGTVKLTLPANLFLLPCLTQDPPPVDRVTYSVAIEDRALNRSNTIVFQEILLNCP